MSKETNSKYYITVHCENQQSITQALSKFGHENLLFRANAEQYGTNKIPKANGTYMNNPSTPFNKYKHLLVFKQKD